MAARRTLVPGSAARRNRRRAPLAGNARRRSDPCGAMTRRPAHVRVVADAGRRHVLPEQDLVELVLESGRRLLGTRPMDVHDGLRGHAPPSWLGPLRPLPGGTTGQAAVYHGSPARRPRSPGSTRPGVYAARGLHTVDRSAQDQAGGVALGFDGVIGSTGPGRPRWTRQRAPDMPRGRGEFGVFFTPPAWQGRSASCKASR